MRAAVRNGGRLAVALLLATGTAGLSALPAYADTAALPTVKTNWYWAEAQPGAGGQTLPATLPAQASGVPDGDLAVGYAADQVGAEDKSSALAFDLGSVPLGSTFTSFLVTVPYDPAAHQLTSGTPDIAACELLDGFVAAAGPTPMSAQPPLSLPSCVKGTFKATVGTAGGYVFDITAIANDWSGGAPANGIVLRPTPNLATAQQPFSVSLAGKNSITTAATYTPAPVPVQTTPVTAPGPVLPPPPPLTGVAAPPPIAAVVVPPPVPSVAPAPTPVLNTNGPGHERAVAYVPGSLVPSGLWWLGFLGLLTLLALTSVVLGDPLAPVVVDPRRRRFAEAVRAQTRSPNGIAGPRHSRSRPPRVHPA